MIQNFNISSVICLKEGETYDDFKLMNCIDDGDLSSVLRLFDICEVKKKHDETFCVSATGMFASYLVC
jgi:hypothetical protein